MSITVYRIESRKVQLTNKINTGCYLASVSAPIQQAMKDAHNGDSDNYPSLRVDFPYVKRGIYDIDEYVCCCDSLQKLKDWFDGFFEELIECYNLVKYVITEYIEGDSKKQGFFHLDSVIEREIVQI